MTQTMPQTTALIDGRAIAQTLRAEIKDKVAALSHRPCLAVIIVGDDPASHVYVKNKIKACADAGFLSVEHKLPSSSSAEDIKSVIHALNQDSTVHGILLQLPLPDHLAAHSDDLIQLIDPAKDVDGLTIPNIGKLVAGIDGLVPCTPQGSLRLIKSVEENLSGHHAVIIGRSLLFGKPMGQILLHENCTVTQTHSRTKDLEDHCRRADILIAAVGRPKMVKADWIKPGAILIDVGINRDEDSGKLVGDMDFDTIMNDGKARAITPVPGGVGPMTIACLLANTLKAYQRLKD